MPTLEEVRAEKERRKAMGAPAAPAAPAMQAPAGITLEAIRAEKARRQQQSAPEAPRGAFTGSAGVNPMVEMGQRAQQEFVQGAINNPKLAMLKPEARLQAQFTGSTDGGAYQRAVAAAPYASVDDAINDAARQYGENFQRDMPLPDGYSFVKGNPSDPFDPQPNTTFLLGPDGQRWTQDKWKEAVVAGLHQQLQAGQEEVRKLQPRVDYVNRYPVQGAVADAYMTHVQPALAAVNNAINDAGAAVGSGIDSAPGRVSMKHGGGLVPKVSESLDSIAPQVGNIASDTVGTLLPTVPGSGDLGRMAGEGLVQFGATTARNPAQGFAEAVDYLEPTHIAVQGVMENDPVKTLMGVAGVLPGTSAVGDALLNVAKAPTRAVEQGLAKIGPEMRAPSSPPMFGATESFARPVEPPPVQPPPAPVMGPPVAPVKPPPASLPQTPKPFSMPPQAPAKGNVVARNADRIAGGVLGTYFGGGSGDAWAAGSDGQGGGNPVGAGVGAVLGAMAPRAAKHGLGRVVNRFRQADNVAYGAVRNALKSAGINSVDEALAARVGMLGDKQATIGDLSQEAVNLGAGLSRLPGVAGPQAKAAYEDLLATRAGRLEQDIGTANPNLNTATIQGDLDRMMELAREQATPAYDALRAQHPVLTSPRLEQLRETAVIAPHVKAVDQYKATQEAISGAPLDDFSYWDLVKRNMDAKEQDLIASGATMADIRLRGIEDARAALVKELDNLVPGYAEARQLGGEAPKMKSAFDTGKKLLGKGYRREELQKIISDITGQPLTALQAGVIRDMVGKAEGGGASIASLTSNRAKTALAEVFGPEVADQLQKRFAADAAIMQNAARRNPNVGSVTSQAEMGAGTGPLAALAGAVKTVRSPFEAALTAMSQSGAYNQPTRDLIWQILSGDITRENLERIFRETPRPRGPRGPRRAPARPRAPSDAGSASPDALAMIGGPVLGAAAGYSAAPDDKKAEFAALGALGGAAVGYGAGRAMRGKKPPPMKGPPGAKGAPLKIRTTRDPAAAGLNYQDYVQYLTSKYPSVGSNGSPYFFAAGRIKQANGDVRAALEEQQAYIRHLEASKQATPDQLEHNKRILAAMPEVDPIFYDDAAFSQRMQGEVYARAGEAPPVTPQSAPHAAGSTLSKEGGTAYFTTPGGKKFAVDIDPNKSGSAGVHFAPSGDYGDLSLSEAKAVLNGVIDQVKQDIATNARAEYRFVGNDAQKARIFQQLADRTPAPEGYRWETGTSSGGVSYPKLVREGPVANGLSGKSLPMDEASRMERRKEWAKGYEEFAPELYIGTTHDVGAFDTGKYNIENDWGRAVYATNSKTDVAHNYAGHGPDLTNRIQLEAERIADDTGRHYSDADVIAEAQRKLTTHEGATMPVVGRMKRTLRVGGKDETFLEMDNAYNPETDEYGEATGPLVDLMQGLRDASAKYNDVGDIQTTIDDLYEVGMDGGITASGALKVLRDSDALLYATDDAGALASHEIIREAFQRAGFDGVIDRTVSQRFKNMKGMDENTAHYVFFDPSNIRGKFAKFDPAESSSSKLLAGIGDHSVAAGAVGGGAYGYLNPQDVNHDGVIDDKDRPGSAAMGALGGAVSLGIAGSVIGKGVRKFGGKPRPMGAPGVRTMGAGGGAMDRAKAEIDRLRYVAGVDDALDTAAGRVTVQYEVSRRGGVQGADKKVYLLDGKRIGIDALVGKIKEAHSPKPPPSTMGFGGKPKGTPGVKPPMKGKPSTLIANTRASKPMATEFPNVTIVDAKPTRTPSGMSDRGSVVSKDGNGKIEFGLTERGDIRVLYSEIKDAAKGQGLGIEMYEALAQHASRNRKALYSDAMVSGDAVKVYMALKRRGYNVRLANPKDVYENHNYTPSTWDEKKNVLFPVSSSGETGAGVLKGSPERGSAALKVTKYGVPAAMVGGPLMLIIEPDETKTPSIGIAS